MNLYRRVRPESLDDIIGNESSVEMIKKIFEKKEKPQTYLLTGPSGCGKTTLARIISKMLGVDNEFGIQEINSSSNRGIDTARDILELCKYSVIGSCRVFIIDEVHQTTKDFQNAMLKILEDTPKDTYFFLCTTDPSKLLTALKNRCSEIKLDSLSGEDIYKLLRRVSRKENIEISKEILEEISENCDGSPRKALVILEKILGLTDEKQIKEIISIGEDVEAEVIELCRILLKTKDWKEISKVLKAIKETDYEKIRYAILGYMNSTLINSGMGKAALIIDCFIDPFYNCGKAGLTLACYKAVFGG